LGTVVEADVVRRAAGFKPQAQRESHRKTSARFGPAFKPNRGRVQFRRVQAGVDRDQNFAVSARRGMITSLLKS
jgi:hypothetical protein